MTGIYLGVATGALVGRRQAIEADGPGRTACKALRVLYAD